MHLVVSMRLHQHRSQRMLSKRFHQHSSGMVSMRFHQHRSHRRQNQKFLPSLKLHCLHHRPRWQRKMHQCFQMRCWCWLFFSLIGYCLLQGFNKYTVADLVLAPYRLMRSRWLDLLWQRKWNLASQWRLLRTWAQKPKLLSKQLGWIANVQIQGHGIQTLNPKELLYLSVCIYYFVISRHFLQTPDVGLCCFPQGLFCRLLVAMVKSQGCPQSCQDRWWEGDRSGWKHWAAAAEWSKLFFIFQCFAQRSLEFCHLVFHGICIFWFVVLAIEFLLVVWLAVFQCIWFFGYDYFAAIVAVSFLLVQVRKFMADGNGDIKAAHLAWMNSQERAVIMAGREGIQA